MSAVAGPMVAAGAGGEVVTVLCVMSGRGAGGRREVRCLVSAGMGIVDSGNGWFVNLVAVAR